MIYIYILYIIIINKCFQFNIQRCKWMNFPQIYLSLKNRTSLRYNKFNLSNGSQKTPFTFISSQFDLFSFSFVLFFLLVSFSFTFVLLFFCSFGFVFFSFVLFFLVNFFYIFNFVFLLFLVSSFYFFQFRPFSF